MNNNEYIAPVPVKLSPDGKYFVYAYGSTLFTKKTKGFKTEKTDYSERIVQFEFSQNGKYLMVNTDSYLYRYTLNNGWDESGKVAFLPQCNSTINNNGDIIISTIPDYKNPDSDFYLWGYKKETLTQIGKIPCFKPEKLLYNTNQVVICNFTYTYDYPNLDMRNTTGSKILSIDNRNTLRSIDIEEKDLSNITKNIYYFFKEDNILINNTLNESIDLLDMDMKIIKQIPVEQLKISPFIQSMVFSPSYSYMAILWHNENSPSYLNVIDCNTFEVKRQIKIKEKMLTFETFSVTDKGAVSWVNPNKHHDTLRIYKFFNNKVFCFRKLKIY